LDLVVPALRPWSRQMFSRQNALAEHIRSKHLYHPAGVMPNIAEVVCNMLISILRQFGCLIRGLDEYD